MKRALVVCVALLVTGCFYTRSVTHSKRSATEQLLISESVARAVAGLDLPVRGQKVAGELSALPSTDADYAKVAVEARLRELGARVVDPAEAERTVVVLAGSLGTADREFQFGIPSIPLPGGAATPSLPFLRIVKLRGYSRLDGELVDRDGSRLAVAEPTLGRAKFELYGFLFFVYRSNDIYPGEESSFSID